MRLRDLMSTPVETIEGGASVAEARERMRVRRVRHLVVRSGGRLLGIVSERDVGGPRGLPVEGRVGDVMSRGVVTAPGDSTLREAANLLRGNAIGCLPVVDAKRLVGIVTISDVLDALGRGAAPSRERAKPYVARRQGPLGKPRGERLKARGRAR